MKRLDTAVRAAFVTLLVLTAALFAYALNHADPQGEAYVGSFAVNTISNDWIVTYSDGTTVGGIRLPLDTRQEAGKEVLFRNRLPEDVRGGMRLCLRAQRQNVYIYINGEERGRYESQKYAGLVRQSPESAFAIADLRDGDASGELLIRIVPRSSERTRFHEVTYAYGNNIWFPYIARNIALVIIGVILIIAGAFSIGAYFFMRKRMTSLMTVLRLAEVLVVAGMWMLGESELRQVIFTGSSYSGIFSFLLVEIMPAFLLMYFDEIQEKRYHRQYMFLETAMLALTLFNSFLNFTGAASYYRTLTVSHVLALLGAGWAVVALALDVRTKRIRNYSITAIGMLLLLAFAVGELANFYFSNSIGFGVYLGLGLLALLGATVMQTAKDEILHREQKQHADNANQAKSVFLANMSHEIRTPINAILGMDEMILRESADEQIRSYAGDIRDAGKTLLSLINDILDFSKIEEGRMEIRPTQYDLTSVINDLVSMVRGRAEVKGLRFTVNVDENTPQILYGDEIRIRQCALNLLTNAVKYTEKGSVTLEVGYKKWSADTILLKFRVSDTGIGIRKKDVERLYTPFFRVAEKRNRTIEGTGLGMSITKQLLMLMDSTLEVQSVYGEGSTFSFAVVQPVVKWDGVGKFTGHYETDAAKRTYHERLHAPDARILVIDDTPLNLAVVKGLLKKTEIQIDTAESGPEAIEMARNTRYDILFVDHMMPGMDGIETLAELKKLPGGTDNVYIALTANALSGSRERYLEAGFTDYLSKPVGGEKLEEMLLTYLPPEKRSVTPKTAARAPERDERPCALIVDDDEALRRLAGDIMEKSFRVETCAESKDAARLAERLHPEIILLDIDSGQMNGFEVLRALRERPDTSDIPVIFLTGASDEESEIACFRSGAADFVRKPFVPEVLLQRTRRIVALDRLQRGLQSEVRRQTQRAESLSREMMLALSKAVDAKDHYTNGHSQRVAAYAAEIARRMGKSRQEQERLYEMGLMHDIGKIGVSEELINKDEHLTDEEFEQIKRHTLIGCEILALITQMPELADGARSHHEHYDGTGYPDGLKGTEIPEAARILCVADCYDAMTSTRIYSPCWKQEAVRAELVRCSGTQFDPDVARVMLAMIDEDKDYVMTERTADINVWQGSAALWTETAEEAPSPARESVRAPEAEAEDAALPGWLHEVDGLDTELGTRHCGAGETYLETLKIYAGSAAENAKEIETLREAGDITGVITKVHALKSTSRAIGAAGLGDFAERLELAGKAGDTEGMLAELDELLARFRALGRQLAPLCGAADADDESLPLISDEKLREAYDALREVLSSMDFDSVAYFADYLRGYRIPEPERERCSRILRAVDDFDWEKISELLE